MTTEVAVLNKFGVALAADSAVTVEIFHQNKTQRKVHNTANKLFTLSKFEPVGVMFYNSVTLGGVPWETAIKMFRKNLFKTRYDRLEEYADKFFEWLNVGSLFSSAQVKDIVETNIIRMFVEISDDKKTKKAFVDALDKEIANLKKLESIPGFDDAFKAQICKEYRASIEGCAKACLKNSYVAGQRKKILEYVGLRLTKKRRLPSYSGIVIAGFGDGESLPRLREYIVDIVVAGRVRFWLHDTKAIDENNQSEVVPLADDEVIRTLIEGISPGFQGVALLGAISLLSSLPKKILDPVSELTEPQKQKYITDARTSLPQHFRDFASKMAKYREENYTKPIKQAISSLSLSDLSMVAETFLGASQIQKRVSPELETVGGPVDVAVISKGDGFVWVKRKHYFEDRFNPSFRQRYLEQ